MGNTAFTDTPRGESFDNALRFRERDLCLAMFLKPFTPAAQAIVVTVWCSD